MTSSKISKHSISPLALKIFKPRAKATFSQTQVRAMALKRLRPHVNVMQAHDCICYDDGHTAILMDRMQGSLSKVKHLDRTSKDILRQLLNGLAHIHRRGYIHRDIKPDNVLYKLDRSNRYIKISDFGLARKVSGA
jgi:serine/threonine protein kinase